MSRYLMKYKGQYRLKPNLDIYTNDFPRTDYGNVDPSYDDIYIKCANGSQIYHYGHSTLVAYIPSLGRGHNILISIAKELKLISEDAKSRDYGTLHSLLGKDGTVFDIMENDLEIEFKIHVKDIKLITRYIKPKTSGTNISPFSDYKIPDEDLTIYKDLIEKIDKNRLITIKHITNLFLKSMAAQNMPYEAIKSDMNLKCMKAKDYINSIGEWNNYIKYLENELCVN